MHRSVCSHSRTVSLLRIDACRLPPGQCSPVVSLPNRLLIGTRIPGEHTTLKTARARLGKRRLFVGRVGGCCPGRSGAAPAVLQRRLRRGSCPNICAAWVVTLVPYRTLAWKSGITWYPKLNALKIHLEYTYVPDRQDLTQSVGQFSCIL